jgi:hypothetical protein
VAVRELDFSEIMSCNSLINIDVNFAKTAILLFSDSHLVNSSGFDSTATTETVELEAGHSYTINADRTTGHGYGMYLWVSDDNSGIIVAGTKKP